MAPQSPKSPSKSASNPVTPKTPKSPSEPVQGGSPNPLPEITMDGPIVVDEDDLDETSSWVDNASSSASIASSIFRYRYENGRRYHAYKDGSYPLPNDEIETDRLDMQHHMFQHLTFGGKLFLAPIDADSVHRVLDCGTGTGIWAIDFADDHPNAEVIGNDLSALQPSFVPPNVKFYVEDLEDTWASTAPYDFIYCRMLTGSIANFPKFFRQSYDNLSPGGYIELADIAFPLECEDDSLPKDSALYRWSCDYLQGSINLNRRCDSVKFYEQQLAEAGFVNIVAQKFRWPLNAWPKDKKFKELGMWMHENLGANISGLSLAMFTRGLGWTPERLEVELIEVRKQMGDRKCHAYAPIYVVYGQKPTSGH